MTQDEIQATLQFIARKHYVTPERIIGPERNKYTHEARKAVARALYAHGLTSVQIGAVLQRHQTTVLAMLGRVGARSKAA